MTRFALLLLLMLVAARFLWRLVETVLRGAMRPPPQGARRGGPPASVKMQPCPVCGTFVVPGKALTLARAGDTYWFCSERCRAEFATRRNAAS